RGGGGDDRRDAVGGRGRPGGGGRRARGPAAPHGVGGVEVLGVQAGACPRRGGVGVPGRQRLRRGIRYATAVPRVAADVDLGRFRQRRRPRRAARDGEAARAGAGVLRRGRQGRRGGPEAGRGHRGGAQG